MLLEGFLANDLLEILPLVELVDHVALNTRQREVHVARIQRYLFVLEWVPELLVFIQDFMERFQSNGVAEHRGHCLDDEFVTHLVQNIVSAYPRRRPEHETQVLRVIQLEAHLVVALVYQKDFGAAVEFLRDVNASVELADFEARKHTRHEVQVLLIDE